MTCHPVLCVRAERKEGEAPARLPAHAKEFKVVHLVLTVATAAATSAAGTEDDRPLE